MRIVALFLAIVILASCERELQNTPEQPVEKEVAVKSEKNVSERFLRIEGKVDTLRHFALGKDLFGKFHKQRFECYIIENPNRTLYSRPVRKISLYFIDGILAKTKYELNDDISDDLIQSHGEFTIQGYDTLTRILFQTEKIIQKVNQKKVLNKNLTNYRLKWIRESKIMYSRVDKRAPKKRFEYIETIKDYEARYRAAEHDF